MTEKAKQNYFDVGYGIASASITAGNLAVSTTRVAYHGIAVLAGSGPATITIYDAIGTATGNIVDLVFVGATAGTHIDRYIPVMARYGMYLVASGTGLTGSIFYGPKG